MMFGQRLKLARRRSGFSLRELSSRIGGLVSAQAIGKYERGEMMPGSSVVIALADALDVSVAYLLNPSAVALESVEFRKLASTRVKERAKVEATVLDHVDRYLQVEELLDIASGTWEMPDGGPYPAGNVEGGEPPAAKVRQDWRLGAGAVPDMTELLEEHGVKVLKLDFPRTVDGLTCLVHRADGSAVPRGGVFYRQVNRKAAVHPCPRAGSPGDGYSAGSAGREDLRPVCRAPFWRLGAN